MEQKAKLNDPRVELLSPEFSLPYLLISIAHSHHFIDDKDYHVSARYFIFIE